MIYFDFETKSYAELKKVGAWVYSEDPTTDIICLCYAIDDGPIRQWWPGLPMPADFRAALEAGHELEAHNVSFEYSIWVNIMVKRYGWPAVPNKKWRDSMAVACYYSLPAALDKLLKALGYKGKNPDGARLITRYSKLYLKTAKAEIPPQDFKKWLEYCGDDVAQEREISYFLGDLPEHELELFQLELDANVRGLRLDLAGIEAASAIVDQRSAELEAEFKAITGGLRPTQRDKCLAWFAANGLVLENMQADYLKDLLAPDAEVSLPQGPARRALEIRRAINKASTKKLDAMARAVASDERAHFQTRYHGAGTGRNTGTGFQPLNLVRGYEDTDPNDLVDNIMYRDAKFLDAIYGDAMDAVAKAARHWIIAAPSCRILAGDFVSIEAIVLPCLAGEDWKVDLFRNKQPVYEVMGARIHGLPPEVALERDANGKLTFKSKYPNERQDGKRGELAFGYQGALNAWLKFDNSGAHTDEAIIGFCKTWRGEHPMVVDFWHGLQKAAIEAVRFPGRRTSYREIGFEIVDDWLTMILPDGKRLWYYKPELRTQMPRWHEPLLKDDCAAGTCKCRPQPSLTYMAMKGGMWRRVSTYGGKLAENATQATARQIMAAADKRLNEAGYPRTLTVYDQLVAEPEIGFGSAKEFQDIIEVRPDWCKDWPIRADVFEGDRYKT